MNTDQQRIITDSHSALLRGILERLVRVLRPERIVLFGSYAKGTAKPGSDIDLLVVLDMEGDPRPYLARAKQLVERNFPRVDLILATRDEIEEQPPQRAAFLLSALETGITVFQRD